MVSEEPFNKLRQQTDDARTKPEIMQFKASQQLLHPDQFSSSSSSNHDQQQRIQNAAGIIKQQVYTNAKMKPPQQPMKEMITDSIKYAAEYVAYFFYSDPFIPGAEIEKFTLELANSILKTILQGEDKTRKLVQQQTPPNSKRECCQRSDEFVLEINIDGKLAALIADTAQSVMTLTPPEISDLLPDNTYVVISHNYAFYSTNHGPCVFIFKTPDCSLPGCKFPLKRHPVIRWNKLSQCFEQNRKWFNGNTVTRSYTHEIIPRLRVFTEKEDRLLHSASDQAIAQKKYGHEIMGQRFFELVKSRIQ